MIVPIINKIHYNCPYCQKKLISFSQDDRLNLNSNTLFDSCQPYDKREPYNLFLNKSDQISKNNSLDISYIYKGKCSNCGQDIFSAQRYFSLSRNRLLLLDMIEEKYIFENLLYNSMILNYIYSKNKKDLLIRLHHKIYKSEEEVINNILNFDIDLFFLSKNFEKEKEIISFFKGTKMDAHKKNNILESLSFMLANEDYNIICNYTLLESKEYEFNCYSEYLMSIIKFILKKGFPYNDIVNINERFYFHFNYLKNDDIIDFLKEENNNDIKKFDIYIPIRTYL